MYRAACESNERDDEIERFIRHRQRLYPDPHLLPDLISFRRKNGRELGADELIEEFARAPSFGHLPLLMELGQRKPEAEEIRHTVAQIVNSQAGYQCGNCGFTSAQVLWHCPGCRAWGSFGAAGRFNTTSKS